MKINIGSKNQVKIDAQARLARTSKKLTRGNIFVK